MQLVAFCVFEAAVGLFWPSMMKMRSQHVPEETRSTIINFFRIPLNLFVCVVLYNVRLWQAQLACFCMRSNRLSYSPLFCQAVLGVEHVSKWCAREDASLILQAVF